MAEALHFDARLKEGVDYFERMLRVMPGDRTTLEFLTVAYAQLGETEKSERALADLSRVLLKKGDLEGALALLPRLEAAGAEEAQTMAVRIKAAGAPRPELVPESGGAEGQDNGKAEACEAEALFAEELGETELAESIRAMPDVGQPLLVSALSMLEREKPEGFEQVLARLADETGEVPIPLDAFDPDRQLVSKLPDALVRLRGVIPFARLGSTALVVTLSPKDEALKARVTEALGTPTRFFLAEPRLVEAAIRKLYPED